MTFMIYALGLPFVVALVVLGVASWIGRRGEGPSSPRWAGAVGLGAAYALGHAATFEWIHRVQPWWISVRQWAGGGEDWPFSLSDAAMWLFWLVIAATIFGWLDAAWPSPSWARWQSRLLVIGFTLALLLRIKFAEVWTTQESVIWTLGLGAAMFVFWSVLDARASRLGPGMPLPLMILSGGLAAVMILHHSILRMLLAGGLTSAIAGAWVVSWWDRRLNLSRGGIPVFATAFSGLLLDAFFWQDVPKSILLLLAAAPLATFVDRIGPISRLKSWQVALIRAVAIAIPVGVAVGLAYAWQPLD